MVRHVKIWFGILLTLAVLLSATWFSGGATKILLNLSRNHLLPYRAGKEFSVTRLEHLDAELSEPNERVRLTLSRARLLQALRESGGWHRAVPPGLVRDGLLIEGEWTPFSHGRSVGVTLPVEIVVGETNGDHPHLIGALPVSMLNAYMEVEFEEDFVNEDEAYAFGHFNYTFWPNILQATLHTTNHPGLPPSLYLEKLGIDVRAKGKVKLKFEENLFRASTEGDIDLHLAVTVRPLPSEAGITLDYAAVFRRLKGNIKNLHSYGDKKVAEKLRKKWTKSLNKEKRKQKLARHTIPSWVPLDLVIELTFHPDPRP